MDSLRFKIRTGFDIDARKEIIEEVVLTPIEAIQFIQNTLNHLSYEEASIFKKKYSH